MLRRGAGHRHPPHHLDSPAAGEVHVEQHHLRLVLGDGGDRLVDVGGLGQDVDVTAPDALQLGADAPAEHRVVVDDHDHGTSWLMGCSLMVLLLSGLAGQVQAHLGARRRARSGPRPSRRGAASGR